MANCSCPEELDKQMQDFITKRQRHRERAANLGRYLPLSVYAKQGFDTNKIQRETTDTQVLPGLGLCYRVAIPEVGDIVDRDTIREQTFQPQRAVPAAATVTPNTAPADPAADAAAKAAAKAATKEDAGAMRRVRSEAAKILAKVAPTMLESGHFWKQRNLKDIHEWALDNAKTSFVALQSAETEAKRVLAGKDSQLDVTASQIGDHVE